MNKKGVEDWYAWQQGNQTDMGHYLVRIYETAKNFEKPTILELGIGAGASSSAFLFAIADKGGILFSVDIQDTPGAEYRAKWHPPDKIGELGAKDEWYFIHQDDLETAKTWDLPIDILFVDADHTYEHVLAELRAFSKWVRPGGLILIHDTNVQNFTGVKKAMLDFLAENNQFVKEREDTDWPGLAWLRNVTLWGS